MVEVFFNKAEFVKFDDLTDKKNPNVFSYILLQNQFF